LKPPSLLFTAAQYHDLLEWAQAGRPYEVCGIIGGASRSNRAETIYALPNIAADPRTRYQIEPQALLHAYFEIERAGLEMIGIVHSHPASVPIPSATDIVEATWPDVVYVIIGFEGDQASVRAWQIRNGRAQEVTIMQSP
jgi:desampylase